MRDVGRMQAGNGLQANRMFLCVTGCLAPSLLSQRSGLLFYLFLGADGYCDHPVCGRRQCGEARV